MYIIDILKFLSLKIINSNTKISLTYLLTKFKIHKITVANLFIDFDISILKL